MKRRKTLVFAFLLLCGLASGALWVISSSPARGQSQDTSTGASPSNNSLGRLDTKAKAAKSGDEARIGELADEVLASLNVDEAPAGMADAIKERLVRAEANYRNGRGKGSSEFDIVRTVNGVAKKLNLPDYAKTNVFEIRRLEMNVLPLVPNFLGGQRNRREDARKGSINAELSPLQAVFVMGRLVQQKRNVPDSQLTNDEWVAFHGGRRTAQSKALFQTAMESRRGDSTRTIAIDQAIKRGMTNIGPAELLNLPDRVLDALGIEHTEGRKGQ